MQKVWTKAIVVGGVLLALVALYFMFGTGESYKSLTQQEAMKVMDNAPGCLILDVRTETEYAGGHIPNAVCLPIGTIREDADAVRAALPDRQQVLLIYCYAGRRAVEAAKILASMGYRNAYEFGGIVDWTGEVVAEEGAATEEAETPADTQETPQAEHIPADTEETAQAETP